MGLVSKKILDELILVDLDGNPDIFQDLLKLLKENMQAFQQFKGDEGDLKAAAHKLRSACLSFGAETLAGVLEEIESDETNTAGTHYLDAVNLLEPTFKEIESHLKPSHMKRRKGA